MENPKIMIESDGSKITEFYVDGKKIENANSIYFVHVAGEKPSCNYTIDATARKGV